MVIIQLSHLCVYFCSYESNIISCSLYEYFNNDKKKCELITGADPGGAQGARALSLGRGQLKLSSLNYYKRLKTIQKQYFC